MHAHQILTPAEVRQVLEYLHKKRKKSKNAWMNLAVFRLSCCCGLRVKEICGIDLDDLVLGGPHPRVVIRPDVAKGNKKSTRTVPLTWDAGTLKDLQVYYERRGQSGQSPVITTVNNGPLGGACTGFRKRQRVTRRTLQKRWTTAIKCLGPHRQKDLPIHCGRRTFASHSLAVGHSLAEIQAALGHDHVSTTSVYIGLVEVPGLPDVFG